MDLSSVQPKIDRLDITDQMLAPKPGQNPIIGFLVLLMASFEEAYR